MADALARHDAALLAVIDRHGGRVFSAGGDGFAAVFDDATSAGSAAVDAQRELSDLSLRVRMGIHAGRAMERDDNYYGPTLNRAARLMSVGHGGQVLVSDAAAALARPTLPSGVTLRDLGTHRLRDLAEPERIWQLSSTSSAESFPPLRTLDVFATNLPAVPERFVGREHDLQQVIDRVRSHRVVTITGPGGVGKTRLALVAAAELLPDFVDGCWLVELGSVDDDRALVGTVAASLAITNPINTIAGLIAQLRHLHALVVLDNCEHLVDAVADLVADIVAGCSRVSVLATSREGLAIDAEHLWPLRPLDQPAAAALFLERAHAVRPDLPDDAAAVDEIVQRLDGIPLAIELAAARVSTLSTPEIAVLLDDRFRLLTGSRRAKRARHRTLQAMVDWSYDLLDDDGRTLLRRLGVFAGGFTMDAAHVVGGLDDLDGARVLDVVQSLVDRSLLAAEVTTDSTRYRYLETIRHYALDRLHDTDEMATVARAHAEWFAGFARRLGDNVWSADEALWLARATDEFDNFRTAVSFALDKGDAELLVRLVAPLHKIAHLQRQELGECARRALAVPGVDGHPGAGGVHLVLARHAYLLGELETSIAEITRALDYDLDSHARVVAVTTSSAFRFWQGDIQLARALASDGIALAETLADRTFANATLLFFTHFDNAGDTRGDAVVADADSTAIPFLRSYSRTGAGIVLMAQRRPAEAAELFLRAAEIAQAAGNVFALRTAASFLDLASSRAEAATEGGRSVAARAQMILDDASHNAELVIRLATLAVAAHRAGHESEAAMLVGYLNAHGEELGVFPAAIAFMTGGRLERLARADTSGAHEYGRTMNTDELFAVLRQLTTSAAR